MRKLITIFIVLTSLQTFAQADPTDSATVIVHKDPRLDQLVTLQAQINEETSRDSRKSGKGYRLMIISTSNREEAIAAKTTIYNYFPELQPYLWHQSPYYKVKAGNFRERKDAESYQQRMKIYFPKGVFVMNDIIELKPEKNEDL
ncbi:MAG: SPOR domain-containing protein [Chitinophagaceae bacterium]